MFENKTITIGNLTRTPELKTSGNTVLCSLNIAVNSTWTDSNGQKQESVEFISATVFGKQAENCAKYLVKGQKVYVEGKIKNRVEEKDGSKVYHTGIVANRVQFGQKPNPAGAENGGYQKPEKPNVSRETSSVEEKGFEYPTEVIDPADIPF